MSVQGVPFSRLTWARVLRVVKAFSASEVGGRAKWLFALLITLLFGVNGLNVVNSYVGRDFVTAMENRNMAGFVWQAIVYIGVFAASTAVAVVYRFSEERLGLLWREWLTRRLVVLYLDHRIYYRLGTAGGIANPDQRIADDVRAYTATTLSFVLILLNASFTVIAFSGVMWSISPPLFGVAVLYAGLGSFLTIALGRPLVRLNYDQLDKEANFRAGLIHVRENAESIALFHREGGLRARLLRHLDELTTNFRRMITVNRNLGFFTTGYNYAIQLIPALIVAPLFIRGQVEFGVITQSAMAFTHLLGAFSLVITQFQSISSYTAVVARIGTLGEGMQQAGTPMGSPALAALCDICVTSSSERAQPATPARIEIREEDSRIAYERLTLRSPRDGRLLVKDLSVSVPYRTRLLILGPNETAKVALFRATAGMWDAGEGLIIRPGLEQILFLPERPYTPPGTLRELLLPTGQENAASDDRIRATLRLLDLEAVLARAANLDAEQDWDDILSLGEQQLLGFARVLLAAPRFAFLHRQSTVLSPGQVDQILRMLSDRSITYLTIGDADDKLDNYDAVLELAGDGGWTWKLVSAGRILEETTHGGR